jgi:thiol-disulfide isomerase/thioredoxin
MEIKFAKNKRTFLLILFFMILGLINAFIFIKRSNTKELFFEKPVSIGSIVESKSTGNNKEILFIFIRPRCHICEFYKDSIALLYNKYNKDIQFLGLCNPKFWDENYLKSYNFEFIKVDVELRRSLHLALTPQFVLVQKNRVTFSNDFNVDIQNEYTRLKKYLAVKYKK